MSPWGVCAYCDPQRASVTLPAVRSRRIGRFEGPMKARSQVSTLVAMTDVAACAAVRRQTPRRRQSSLLTPHC
eukprot:7075132-Prymnesium_polylepis.1